MIVNKKAAIVAKPKAASILPSQALQALHPPRRQLSPTSGCDTSE